MGAGAISFETIDLDRHASLCVQFSRDTFVCSFGDDARFEGPANYLAWLSEGIDLHPGGHLHLWRDGRIIGQIAMRVRSGPPPLGYINHFYLVPEVRGSGAADVMHAHALDYLRGAGARVARLSVSPSNARARAFYASRGWRDLGPRPGQEHVHYMERGL